MQMAVWPSASLYMFACKSAASMLPVFAGYCLTCTVPSVMRVAEPVELSLQVYATAVWPIVPG